MHQISFTEVEPITVVEISLHEDSKDGNTTKVTNSLTITQLPLSTPLSEIPGQSGASIVILTYNLVSRHYHHESH
ncbi:hypothetical protein EON65_49125 [archaeon]|nr:MAG: hypothetical protein EON65_49125 [archaeon]